MYQPIKLVLSVFSTPVLLYGGFYPIIYNIGRVLERIQLTQLHNKLKLIASALSYLNRLSLYCRSIIRIGEFFRSEQRIPPVFFTEKIQQSASEPFPIVSQGIRIQLQAIYPYRLISVLNTNKPHSREPPDLELSSLCCNP